MGRTRKLTASEHTAPRQKNARAGNAKATNANVELFKPQPIKNKLTLKNKTDAALIKAFYEEGKDLSLFTFIRELSGTYLKTPLLSPAFFTLLVKQSRVPVMLSLDSTANAYNALFTMGDTINTCCALFLGFFPCWVVVKPKNVTYFFLSAEDYISTGVFDFASLACDTVLHLAFTPNWANCIEVSFSDFGQDQLPTIFAHVFSLLVSLGTGQECNPFEELVDNDSRLAMTQQTLLGLTLMLTACKSAFLKLTFDSFQYVGNTTQNTPTATRTFYIDLVQDVLNSLRANMLTSTQATLLDFPLVFSSKMFLTARAGPARALTAGPALTAAPARALTAAPARALTVAPARALTAAPAASVSMSPEPAPWTGYGHAASMRPERGMPVELPFEADSFWTMAASLPRSSPNPDDEEPNPPNLFFSSELEALGTHRARYATIDNYSLSALFDNI
jgi:hypothetical protein